jgi:hypothetical protein
MSDESTSFLEKLKQSPGKWLALLIAATTASIGAALLRAWGDPVFDAIVAALGKRLFLQSILVLICILGYLGYLVFAHHRKKLYWKNGLYWSRGDGTPYCPCCYEKESKPVHMTGPIELWNSEVERWDCPLCESVYCARTPGDKFIRHANIRPM